MKIEEDTKLDFTDVLIRPKRSTLSSRNDIVLEREFKFPNTKQVLKCIPIIASNMDTIGTVPMYNKLKEYNMITCFNKFLDIDEYPDNDNDRNNYIVSIGIRDEDFTKLELLYKKSPEKCNMICIDVANGYIKRLVEFCNKVREFIPHCILVAGNVVSREMTEELIINGKVDIVKVGIGNGSVCTTRIQTGVGIPQLSSIIECADAAHGCGGHIICDGGITCPGDASKAFGAGADFVMIGSLFAGHDESGGEFLEEKENGKQYKVYYGMSSDTAMNKHYGGVNKYRSSEGKTVKVPYKGPVENTVDDLLGGIRSTCTYVNARQLKDLSKCTTFVRVNNQANKLYK